MKSLKKKHIYLISAEVKIFLQSFVILCILVDISTPTRSAVVVAEKSKSSNIQLLVSANIFLANESGINWIHCFAKLWISVPDIIVHGCQR